MTTGCQNMVQNWTSSKIIKAYKNHCLPEMLMCIVCHVSQKVHDRYSEAYLKHGILKCRTCVAIQNKRRTSSRKARHGVASRILDTIRRKCGNIHAFRSWSVRHIHDMHDRAETRCLFCKERKNELVTHITALRKQPREPRLPLPALQGLKSPADRKQAPLKAQ